MFATNELITALCGLPRFGVQRSSPSKISWPQPQAARPPRARGLLTSPISARIRPRVGGGTGFDLRGG